MILVYFPVAHWVWGGGFLAKLGFVDYAGGTVIHITSGFGCLGGLAYLGRRAYPNEKGPFHLGFVVIGAAILLFGWFGFNAGGSLAAAETAAIVFTNTAMAASSSMIVWTILYYIKNKTFLIAQVLALRSQAPMRNGPDTGEGLFLSVFLLAYVLPFEFADCLYPVFG